MTASIRTVTANVCMRSDPDLVLTAGETVRITDHHSEMLALPQGSDYFGNSTASTT